MLNCKVICVTLLCFILCACNKHIEINQNFRHVGKLATGLSYGHIHTTVKFSDLKYAVKTVMKILQERLRKDSTSTTEKEYIKMMSPRLQISYDAIEDLQDLFFGENNVKNESSVRKKRQLFLGIAIALGIFNTGMSIYNIEEIARLHLDITELKNDMVVGFKHVAHILREEEHAIFQMTKNINILKENMRYTLDALYNQEAELNQIKNAMTIGAALSNINAEVAAWGRGLESLSHGRLHPTLVDKKAVKDAFDNIIQKASRIGLKPLHQDYRSVFKNPISYFSTTEESIIVIVHIPLVEYAPLDIYEYLPIPVHVGQIFVTLEGRHTLLATDLQGRTGLEMSNSELLKCQSENLHDGKLWICPNTNLLMNRIRNSCLGSIFYGHQNEALQRCFCQIQLPETHMEFVKQVSENTVSLYTKDDLTIRQTCQGKVEILPNITGLATIVIPEGCKMVTEDYTFISPAILDINSDFIRKTMKIPHLRIFNETNLQAIEKQMRSLNQIKNPNKINLETLKKWIQDEEIKTIHRTISYSSNAIALIGCGLVVTIIIFLYCRFRKRKTTTSQ